MKKQKAAASGPDPQFYQHMQQLLLYHQSLLRDEERNRLFFKALESVVTSDTRVLDIGSGSGVWAITAAKLGAKSVTAIEENPPLIPVIMAHAAENGVADRIEIINGLSLDAELKHKYDVVVSETIGNQAFDENIIPTMVDARERFLAEGGQLIPQKIALKAAPAHLITETASPQGVALSTSYINNLSFNVSSRALTKDQVELIADPVKLVDVDLRDCTLEQDLSGMVAEWSIDDLSRANVIAIWAECELVDGVVLDTWKTSSWMPVVLRFRPMPEEKGTLRFGLSIDQKLYHWTVGSGSGTMQAYTPVFAYTKIKLDSLRAPEPIKPRKR